MSAAACDETRPLLSALVDGELDAADEQRVHEHLAACEGCAEALDAHARTSALVGAHARRPSPDLGRWAALEAALAAEMAASGVAAAVGGVARGAGPRRASRPWGQPVAWGLVAAAATLGIALGLSAILVSPARAVVLAWPHRHLPDLAYQDPLLRAAASGAPLSLPRGLAGIEGAGAASGLTAAQRAALERDGLVQVPAQGASLAAFHAHAAPGAPNPLVTADAALLVWGGAVARASFEVEREEVAPALREQIALLGRELSRIDAEARSAEVKRAARHARRIAGVAALLEGLEPALAGEDRTAATRDADLVRGGRGQGASVVLGRELDLGAFEPRGPLAGVPEHARTVAWLTAADLRVDPAHPDEARAAALMVLALARGRLADGTPAIARFFDLDDTLRFLHGPPDDLGAFELLGAVRRGLGAATARPEDLAPPAALLAIARAAQETAHVEGEGLVASGGPRAPRFRLVGGTRALEQVVLSGLVDPVVPGRARPTSLDLLGAIGSRTARTLVSLEGFAGYDRAVSALGPAVESVTDAPRALAASGSGLERSRLFALSSLVGPLPSSALAVQRTEAYEDRLLLAGLAGLNAAPAGPEEGELTLDAGAPLPAIEPLPAFYARLAFGARRLALGLEATAAPRSAAVGRATARLRRVSELLSSLARAASEALEDRAPGAEARAALAGFASAARACAPVQAWSVEDVAVLVARDGSRSTLERTAGPLDQLWLVLPVPGERLPDGSPRLRLTLGAALSARELLAGPGRLDLDAVARGPRGPDPEFAAHVVRR